MNFDMCFWDIFLLVIVSLQATAVAYVSAPKFKALLITIPLPFSVAFLALGRPVDATNIMGLTLLLMFSYGVKFLHLNMKINIILSIVVSALTYCFCGWVLAGILPDSKWIFWMACAGAVGLAAFLMITQTLIHEKGHRSPLPICVKLPIIVCVVFLLLMVKKQLGGFMTVFPMVGVVAAYEGRHCLGTITRQMPIVICTLTSMIIFIRLAQGTMGIGLSLVLSWLVFGAAMIPLTRYMWRRLGTMALPTGGVQYDKK